MKKIALSIIFMLITVNLSQAEDTLTFDSMKKYGKSQELIVNKYDNLVGVRFSNISGYGLSFSRRFAEHYEILVCGLVHFRESMEWEDTRKLVVTNETKDVLLDIGFEFKRDFITTSTTCIYGLVGAYYSDDTEKNKEYYYKNELSTKTFSMGIGIGFRFFFDKRFSGNINFGYKYDDIDKLNNDKPAWYGGTYVGLGIGIDFGF